MKMAFKILKPLETSIFKFTSFFRIEHQPFPILKFFVEIQDKQVIDKVYKGISNVCLILIIDWKIEEIIFPLMIFVYLIKELFLIIFVRYVPYHHSGANIFTSLNFL
jgi:hypothetical protein